MNCQAIFLLRAIDQISFWRMFPLHNTYYIFTSYKHLSKSIQDHIEALFVKHYNTIGKINVLPILHVENSVTICTK